MTSSERLMDIAERLTELDPVRTYPQRGATLLAGLVGAHSYRLERAEFVPPERQFFAQATPTGRFPTLVDGDVTLCESTAIVEYVLERYGEGRLAPPIDQPSPQFEILAEFLLQARNVTLQVAQVLLGVAALGFAHHRNVFLDLRAQLLELFLLGEKLPLTRRELFLERIHDRLGLRRTIQKYRHVDNADLYLLRRSRHCKCNHEGNARNCATQVSLDRTHIVSIP